MTTPVSTTDHKPEPWYEEAEGDRCPHGPEPEDDTTDAWDTWQERHQWSPQDVRICLDAPIGDHCAECSADRGDLVPWADCPNNPANLPEPTALPTRYVVSCLPEGHDDRYTFTVQVTYSGNGLYTVKRFLSLADANGNWEIEPGWPETDIDAQQAWLKQRLFDHDTALALAKQLAPTLTYRGRTVADALAAPAV